MAQLVARVVWEQDAGRSSWPAVEQLKADNLALWLSLKVKETPLFTKVLAVTAVGHVHLIPDFIPVLGYRNDLITLPALITPTLKCIPINCFSAKKLYLYTAEASID